MKSVRLSPYFLACAITLPLFAYNEPLAVRWHATLQKTPDGARYRVACVAVDPNTSPITDDMRYQEIPTQSLESIREWLRKLAERLGLVKPTPSKYYDYCTKDTTSCTACDESCCNAASSYSCSPDCNCSSNGGCPASYNAAQTITSDTTSLTVPFPEANEQLVIRSNWPYLIIYTLVRSDFGEWLYSDTIRVYNVLSEEYSELSAAGLYQFFDQLPVPPVGS